MSNGVKIRIALNRRYNMGQLSKVETSLDDLFHKFVLDPEEATTKKDETEEDKDNHNELSSK